MLNANMSNQWQNRETRKQPKPPKKQSSLRRERRYLHKVRLCTNLMRKSCCQWESRCLFAHSLAELSLPDEGHNAMFEWADIWTTKEGVHTWYGQAFTDDTHCILSWRINLEIASEPLKVPDWAIAYAIVHMDLKPFRAPNEPRWGFPQRIEALKAQRGGRLPPGVPPRLPDYMMRKLFCALHELKKPKEETNLLLKLLLADPTTVTALNAEEPPKEQKAGVFLGPAVLSGSCLMYKEPPEEFVRVPATAASDDSEEEVIDSTPNPVTVASSDPTTAGPKETPATLPEEVPHAAGQLATSSSAVLTIAPKKTRRSQPKEVPQHRVTEPQGPIADTSGINKMPRLLQVALNQVRKQQ